MSNMMGTHGKITYRFSVGEAVGEIEFNDVEELIEYKEYLKASEFEDTCCKNTLDENYSFQDAFNSVQSLKDAIDSGELDLYDLFNTTVFR